MLLKRKTNAERKWNELSDYIKTELEEDQLNELGLINLIDRLNSFRKTHGSKYIDYNEVANLSLSISKNIQETLKSYNKTKLEYLTYGITEFENQKSLFNFDKPYTSPLSPEYYFEKVLFSQIVDINNENAIPFVTVCSWVTEYLKSPLENNKKSDNRFNYCGYFLTFFTLSFVLNYDIEKGYCKYIEIINEFSNTPEIIFLLYYILNNVLFNFLLLKGVYFTDSQKTTGFIQKTIKFYDDIFKPAYEKEKFDEKLLNCSSRFNANMFSVINKIITDNCSEANSDAVLCADFMEAKKIANEELVNSLYLNTKKIAEEISYE